jgi:hypothetical protein
MSESMITMKYRCTKPGCGGEDSATEPHPPTGPLNCWKCGAGRSMQPDDMRKNFVGMFRLDDHAWLLNGGGSTREREIG